MNDLETLNDYDYAYPPELVAQRPAATRDASRMLVLSRAKETWEHAAFLDLPRYLRPGDALVVNDTSVLACRMFAQKPSGGKVEVFLLKPVGGLEWSAFLSPARGLKVGMRLALRSRISEAVPPLELTVGSLQADDFRVRFDRPEDQEAALAAFGEMPLPPYIARPIPAPEDRDRYQTVFARRPGAVAAPTAGLHFTETMKRNLTAQGVAWVPVTLHVGAGTFLPVKTERIADHRMHEESYEIPPEAQAAIQRCREGGGSVVAVGTTSLRALESWALSGKPSGSTDLFIRPGFRFQLVDRLLTNFHQPKSTLLMLVSALAGRELILRAYREAIARRYRLFSYGDCMLIQP